MQIDVRVKGLDTALSALKDLHAKQLPFATALALTNTALAFQEEQRKQMAGHFTERRPDWVNKSVKITHFARKTDNPIVATVAIESPGGGSRSDELGKFEQGGDKTSREGGSIAVPDEAKRTKTDIVARSARPRAFGFTVWGTGPKATVYRGQRRTFMIKPSAGQGGGIYQRVGKGKGSTIRQLFSLAKRVRIDRRLGFYPTAQKVAREKFAAIAEAAVRKAIATAK